MQTRCDPFVKELGHIQILPTHELSGTYLEDVRTVPEFTSKGMKTQTQEVTRYLLILAGY